jgi:hypothetical protein
MSRKACEKCGREFLIVDGVPMTEDQYRRKGKRKSPDSLRKISGRVCWEESPLPARQVTLRKVWKNDEAPNGAVGALGEGIQLFCFERTIYYGP